MHILSCKSIATRVFILNKMCFNNKIMAVSNSDDFIVRNRYGFD